MTLCNIFLGHFEKYLAFGNINKRALVTIQNIHPKKCVLYIEYNQ